MAKYGDYIGGADKHIADDFAGLQSPKLKFNFTMSITYAGMSAETGEDDPYEISFGIKQITRPAPNVMYEDVNFYNFMTKVATKVDFGVVTVTLYDDRDNKAHSIFKNYMEAISPITKKTRDAAPLLDKNGQIDSGSLGALPSEGARNGVISNLRVNHIIDWNGKTVIYDFLNPKVQNVTLDELDMTQSDVSTITFTFIYDSYHVETVSGSEGAVIEDFVGPPRFGGGDRDVGTIAANSLFPSDPMSGLSEVVVTAERRGGGANQAAIPGLSSTVGAQIAATLKTEATRYVAGVIAQQNIPNVPAIVNALRNQSYVDGIPSQVLSNAIRRLQGGGG
jgi:hypothetical protein